MKAFLQILLLIFVLSFHVLAADQSGRKVPATPNQSVSGTPILLNDFLKQVDNFHPKLRGVEALQGLAKAKFLEKQGAFDPMLNIDTDFLRYNSASSRGKERDSSTSEISLDVLTRSGIKFFGGARFNLGTVKSPLSSTGDLGEYFFGIKIPLMRNARINPKMASERQALLGIPIADAEFLETRRELLFKASTTYWEWVGAGRKLQITRNLLDLAVTRAEAVKERAKAGDLPSIDVDEANQELERRRGQLIKSERDLQKAALKLAIFLWDSNGNPLPVPTETHLPKQFNNPTQVKFDEQAQAREIALINRPELKMLSLNRDITKVDLELARNDRRPSLDFSFTPGKDTGANSIGTTIKAGVQFTFPFRQRTAEGKQGQAEFKLRKLQFEENELRQLIILEVDDSISAINTLEERFRVAQRELEFARRLEEGEREKFRLGDTTIFLVNQRERATAEAEIKVIDLQVEYEQALAAFKAATNN